MGDKQFIQFKLLEAKQLTEMRNHIAKATAEQSIKQSLALTILTWDKDSHGLFDYQSEKYQEDQFEIQGPCKLFRSWANGRVQALTNDQIKRGVLPSEKYIFHVSIYLKHNGNHENFVLGVPEKIVMDMKKNEQEGPINTNTYIVVKSYSGDPRTIGYPINIGNTLKLGRVEFRAVEIGGVRAKAKNRQNFLYQFQGVHDANESIAGSCKFCLCDEVTLENYLISPCNCKGSCEMVHVECLRMWINSKVKKEVSGVVTTYNFTKFECELCKQPFPRKVVRGSQSIQMLQIEKPSKPYIIIQNINERKQSKQERCLHLICPEQGNNVKIGRGHQCEIRLQDISVSRVHSQIKYQYGNFYLIDQDSKFGTLVLLDKSIDLNRPVKLQAGRSLYELSMQ